MDLGIDFSDIKGQSFTMILIGTDYRPAVAPGDELSVVRVTDRGCWIKKDGVSGWYDGELDFN